MEYKEFSAKTVDDAITAACQDFFVTSDKLDYEVRHKAENVKALALFLLVCGKDK